jgi:gamma-glutamylcyclotransferase (GGCT)/AIG2-like uncharacterized protein YtfP
MSQSDLSCNCGALAVYGSLQPGGPNEHILTPLEGSWTEGFVKGTLEQGGWGAKVGFPGIRLSEKGDPIPVKLFQSKKLEAFWHELDQFEGDEYVRRSCEVSTANGPVTACIYTLA